MGRKIARDKKKETKNKNKKGREIKVNLKSITSSFVLL